ncbi:MAG: hypothetical protein HYV13_00520 [Candidatus Doudnabacteria bacterium]|nr:hypothetical protein [Candidatus Doudnabacteria bacterium]
MREITRKLKRIIESGDARMILLEDDQGRVLLEISPDLSFLKSTLNLVKGITKTVKNCKLIVTKKQLLFN